MYSSLTTSKMLGFIFFINLIYLIHSRPPSASERATILRLHNNARSNVQPTASDMLEMRYNDKLEEIANDWAKTCSTSTPKHLKSMKNIGHNIATIEGQSTFDFNHPINEWLKQRDYFTKDLKCKFAKNCKQYMQMIWASTFGVGCAVMDCTKGKKKSKHMYVCIYQPEGNTHKKPYTQGIPCKDCSSGSVCRNNLCSYDTITTRSPFPPSPVIPPKPVYPGSPTSYLIYPEKEEAKQLTSYYNKLREGVIPDATNMIRAEYSAHLSQQAGKLAEVCSSSKVTPHRFPWMSKYGVTLADVEYKRVPFEKVMYTWNEEGNGYNIYDNTCLKDVYGTKCANYKQLVWHDVKEFGCAAAYCGKGQKGDKYFVACIFNSRADLKYAPYSRGTKGKHCPHNYKFDGHLCTRRPY